jgi:hypothetical protein
MGCVLAKKNTRFHNGTRQVFELTASVSKYHVSPMPLNNFLFFTKDGHEKI